MENNKFELGSLFSIPDLRDYIATTSETVFPESFELNMPRVKNQGSVGSCVAHSLATVVEYFTKKETSKSVKMSTGYIYGNRLLSVHKGKGMYTRDALKTLMKFGDVLYEDFPENVEVPYAIERFDDTNKELVDKGLNYKIKSYFKLANENAIKKHILDNQPVVMTMWWYDDISVKDGILKTDCVKSKNTGGHCMVIYGWNKTGWLVQNSWGTGWGNKGRFILPYSVPMKETWGVTDAASDSSLVVKKPFSSKLGACVAKIIHSVISFFYNIINKTKE